MGWTVAVLLVLAVVGGLAFILSGAYNIAASEPHLGLTRWVLNTTMERSVEAHADEVGPMPPVDSAALREAFAHYGEMCAVCHSAPGEERGEIGEGMNPRPPRLSREGDEWSDQEIFWILKHGIKMAGMPGFGATHSDRQLWALTAVVRQLPELSADEYQARTGHAEQPASGGHTHEEELGGGDHSHDGNGTESQP